MHIITQKLTTHYKHDIEKRSTVKATKRKFIIFMSFEKRYVYIQSFSSLSFTFTWQT